MGKFVRVADTQEIPAGTGKYVDVNGEPIAIFHVDGGSFFATCDTCSHEEASLAEGELEGELIECPLHGAKFNVRTGEAKALPAVAPIKSYVVRLVGNSIEVEV